MSVVDGDGREWRDPADGPNGPRRVLCAGLAPPPKGRINANRQRCGAWAEPGILYCAVHAKASGYPRCVACGRFKVWADTQATTVNVVGEDLTVGRICVPGKGCRV